MGGASSRRLAGAVLAAAMAAVLGPPAAHAAPLEPCSASQQSRTLCARVAVPLDRAGVHAGTVSLRVRALPAGRASAFDPARPTVVALAGGPGQAAVPLLDAFATVLAPALRARQLVTFDQRGTGGSGRLRCSALSGAGSLVSVVGRCATQLGPTRAHYATADSVADLEAVRAALGVERLSLYGTSYGTKLALAYAAAYPQHVERLVLDSVVPPEGTDPFQRMTLGSIPRVMRTLCARDCSFTRDAAEDLRALARRLARAPLRGTVIDGRGHARRARLSAPGLLALLLGGDFDRYARAALPAAVRAALEGDATPLLRLASNASPRTLDTGDDSDAVFAATTCEDGGVPWPAGTPLAQRRALVAAAAAAIPDAAFAPFDRRSVRALGGADLCRAWPEAPIPQLLPPLPATPTLILSGDDDLRTPRGDATALAARLPGAQLVQVPDAGHGVLFSDPTACAEDAVAAFLDGRAALRCRTLPRAAPPRPLPPRQLAELRAAGSLSPRAGRTVTAVLRTLDDATDQFIAQVLAGGRVEPFGGLRAGSATFRPARGLRLRAYVYVPGVTVSGLIASRGRRFTLRVGGAAAAHGSVTLSSRGVSGTLDGESFELGPRALRARAASAPLLAHDPRLALAAILRPPFEPGPRGAR